MASLSPVQVSGHVYTVLDISPSTMDIAYGLCSMHLKLDSVCVCYHVFQDGTLVVRHSTPLPIYVPPLEQSH